MAETMADSQASTPGADVTGDNTIETLSINTVRTLAIDAVERANSGHPGAPMGLAPLAYTLWTRVMRYASDQPDWFGRDRFVLSCGHASMLQYALLHLTGYPLSLDDIRNFRQLGSPTAGHPEYGIVAGVETTTGPLGQGFGNAVGMALGERLLAARFNTDAHAIVDHRTWVLASDGDLMEGVASEAASLAGHLGLAKLCVFWDDNRITIDGPTDLTFSEDVDARFRAYGWNVIRLPDTATVDDYAAAADAARAETKRPTLVACRTHIAAGSPNKHDSSASHGAPLGAEEVRLTKRALGWPEDASFEVPPAVAEHMLAAGRRGSADAAAWHERFAAYRQAEPERAAELERCLASRLPDGWAERLPAFTAGERLATRKASGTVLEALGGALPELIGGSADLAGSNNTTLPGAADVGADHFEGRTLHFGVREHGMGAVLNGMALHGGLRPYGGTFLVFSDYMRASIRLAALMRLRVVYVFTHDSIGVGEDGPTHQPVEHLAALRAIPGLTVIRPADAAETAEAWRVALETDGPVALILSRQGLAVLDRRRLAPASGLRQGAYVLHAGGVSPDVVLLATGSEVELALTAAERLRDEGVAARVVSMPCWERLERLEPAEREKLFGGCRVRIAVEAGVSFGWHRWVGPDGDLVTVDRFGASGPGGEVMAELGFTPENVVAVARRCLARAETRGS